MSDTGNDVQATPGPIPPPVGKFPFVDRSGYLTTDALIVLQQMWAALQGAGGVIDIGVLDLPNPGLMGAAAADAVADAAAGALALAMPSGELAGVMGRAIEARDLGLLLLGRPAAPVLQPSYSATIIASETIAPYALVNVYSNAGAVNARNADTTSAIAAAKGAQGFALSPGAAGVAMTVAFLGFIPGVFTAGSKWLGAAGAISATPNATGGQISQQVGFAVSTRSMWFAPGVIIGT